MRSIFSIAILSLLFIFLFSSFWPERKSRKVFDVHLHGSKEPASQLQHLKNAGVYKAAISTSWNLQNTYRSSSDVNLLFGLMFPCPNGKVPYSLQPCFEGGEEWPSVSWVEEQVRNRKIDFFGETLSQYFGISSSDSLLFPYYALAEKYNLPVGVHTGGAGPNHGSPNFKMEMGDPALLKKMLARFPNLKLWIMHGGDQFNEGAIAIMREHKKVYADISVLSNPQIVPADRFSLIMKKFIDAGLEDRLMFGSDNGSIEKVIDAVEALTFLSNEQKEKVFYKNAEEFFKRDK